MTKFIQGISDILDSFNQISESSNESILQIQLVNPVSLSEIDLKIDLFSQSQNETLITAFKKINYSLITGEYISNIEIKQELENVISKLSETVNLSNDFEKLQIIILDLVSAIKIAIERYKIFISEINNKFSDDRLNYLFEYNQQFERDSKNAELSELSFNLISYFFNNLSLSEVDHFPSIDNSQYKDLFSIEKNTENYNIIQLDEISVLIKLKVGFLEHKWKARKQQENPSAIHYSIDGNTNTLGEFNSSNTTLNEWAEIIDSHYQLHTNWPYQTEKRIKPFKDKPLESLKFLQIHQLIKYYKDVKKTPNKLKEISKFLLDNSNLNQPNTNSYDSYSIKIISNYSLNNKFSLFLETNKEIITIKNEYNRTKEKIKGETNNFFLEFKYLNSLLDILELKTSEIENIDFLEYENIIIEDCKKILDDYFENKEWSKMNNNYIFSLPFDECLVDIVDNTEVTKIFIASSFLLPPENKEIENKYKELRDKYKGILYHLKTIKRLRKDLNKIDELNNAFDKRDFKSIEIISIYTAMITFVLSSIPAYKFIHSVWDSLLFMLTLSSALGIFVMIILFTTRGFKDNSRGVLYLLILFVIAIVGYTALSNFEKKTKSVNIYEKKSIDSIVKVKVDSVFKKKR